MTTERFNVYQFFPDDTYEEAARGVEAEAAVKLAHSLSTSVGAKIGTTLRVIIEDAGGHTCFEWKHGQGVTYPTPEMRADVAMVRSIDP